MRPRNRKRPSAYAASEPTTTDSKVTAPATIVELSRARRNWPLSNTARKLSSVGSSGMYWTGVRKRSPWAVSAERIAQ